jgi:hypothetical protein
MIVRLWYPDGTYERLRWTREHPASRHNVGVVLRGGEVLTGETFRRLRDEEGVIIECSDVITITHALGLPFLDDYQEPGIALISGRANHGR